MLCSWLMLLAAHPVAAQVVSAAEYTKPTEAYPHGALGDDLEWSEIQISITQRKKSFGELFKGHVNLTYHLKAPRHMVFEDTTPRLWDIDGDGRPEVVTVLSHQKYGAQLAVIGVSGGQVPLYRDNPADRSAISLAGTGGRW